MTLTRGAQRLSTLTFLFGTARSGGALAHALDHNGVVETVGSGLARMSRVGRATAASEIASVAHDLLELDLGDLIVGGWSKYGDMTAAARRTADEPGSTELVELVTHRITSRHEPSVELLIDGVTVATIHFDLCAEFTIRGLVGTVWQGRLTALHSGECDVTVSLAAEGRTLGKREAHVGLPLLVRLGDGVPLLRQSGEHSLPSSPAEAGATRWSPVDGVSRRRQLLPGLRGRARERALPVSTRT